MIPVVSFGEFVAFSALKIVCVFAVLMFIVAYAVWVERKVSAAIQDRVGPNRVGIFGLLQPIADAVKSFLKEDFTPGHVRKVYYWLAPAIVMIPSLLTVAIIPFGSQLGNQKMVIADLNVGILYTFGIVSLGVYGIVLAGYAANSKYPFLGGIRSSAQMISYEIAMAMSVVPIFLMVGSLRLSQVVEYQGISLSHWLIFRQPLAFVIFMVAMFAETNRLPFDLPESEQELAGGYNVEYSSMKFALFFMGEYAAMTIASAMMVTLFLGGWTLPFAGLSHPATTFGIGLLHIGIFLAKMLFVEFMIIWVRWMWPRFRYDQLMNLGWRRFIPLALANIVVTALILLAVHYHRQTRPPTAQTPITVERDRSPVAAARNPDERAVFWPILTFERAANGDRSRSVCVSVVWATRPHVGDHGINGFLNS